MVAAGLLALATTLSAPAFAQQGPSGGGDASDDRATGAAPAVSQAIVDNYRFEPNTEFDCDTYLRRAHGPAAAFWQARFEYCVMQSKS